MNTPTCDLSVIIVSYNARDYLRRCLADVAAASVGLNLEVFVVDNQSSDNSCDMVEKEFPSVKLFRAGSNLGFAAANNLAMHQASGRYYLLLNSDAFVEPDALRNSIAMMDATPNAGAAGIYLTFEDGSYQITGRYFPTLFSEFCTLSGLSYHFPKSRIFAHSDRTWEDPNRAAKVGWITGCYMLLRATALHKVGLLDDEFYFYYEDVDICNRLHKAGYEIWYFPQARAMHIGGGSATNTGQAVSSDGSQIILWRMRSMLLYYRKHHPRTVLLIASIEYIWYWLRAIHNRDSKEPHAAERYKRFSHMTKYLLESWRETKGGRYSPPRPW